MSFSCTTCRATFRVNGCKNATYKLDHFVSGGTVRYVSNQLECDLAAQQYANQMDTDTGLPWNVTESLFCQESPDPAPAGLTCI